MLKSIILVYYALRQTHERGLKVAATWAKAKYSFETLPSASLKEMVIACSLPRATERIFATQPPIPSDPNCAADGDLHTPKGRTRQHDVRTRREWACIISARRRAYWPLSSSPAEAQWSGRRGRRRAGLRRRRRKRRWRPAHAEKSNASTRCTYATRLDVHHQRKVAHMLAAMQLT